MYLKWQCYVRYRHRLKYWSTVLGSQTTKRLAVRGVNRAHFFAIIIFLTCLKKLKINETPTLRAGVGGGGGGGARELAARIPLRICGRGRMKKRDKGKKKKRPGSARPFFQRGPRYSHCFYLMMSKLSYAKGTGN